MENTIGDDPKQNITIATLIVKVDRLIFDVAKLSDSTLHDVETLKREMVDRKALEKIEGTVHEQNVCNTNEHNELLKKMNENKGIYIERFQVVESRQAYIAGVGAVLLFVIPILMSILRDYLPI